LKELTLDLSVKAILDANRNALMLLELRFSIWTLGIGAGTFIAALYGMNLKNFFEESDAGFVGVSIICGVGSVVAIMYGLRLLRRVQRVSMWGNHCPPALPRARELHDLRAEFKADEKVRKATEKLREEVMRQHHSQGPLWAQSRFKKQKSGSNETHTPLDGKPVLN
jgi:hypothetical protein